METITRKYIAEKTGTSVSVVSRALNNSGYVSQEKKDRILKLARELNYIPNPVAMSLQTKRTKQLLFYCRDLRNPFNIQMYQGMAEAAQARGYMALVNGSIDFAGIGRTLIDGVIMPNQSVAQAYLEAAGGNYFLPAVSAAYSDGISLKRSIPIVEIDMFKVVAAGLDYLWAAGHRKIALGIPYPYDDTIARACAYKNWMVEKNLSPYRYYLAAAESREWNCTQKSDRISMQEPDGSASQKSDRNSGQKSNRDCFEDTLPEAFEDYYDEGRITARLYKEKNLDATAILGFNDDFAMGLIKGFQELGIRVPQDVSVLGIDGIYARKYAFPKLTTVSIFPEKQGAKCVNVLIDQIEGKKIKYVNHMGYKILKADSVRHY